MIKISVLKGLTKDQYLHVSALWAITGVGNSERGDTFESVNQTLYYGGRVILIYDEEIPVGTVWLTHDFRRLYIHHMAVHPNYRNQGFGKMLMQEALQVARELNLQAKLEVHEDNPVAYELYKSVGFKTLEGFITMIKRDI